MTNDIVNHFKKFISKVYKKEEEALLNKKKKREEIKQKNKSEKQRFNNRNGMNQYNCYPGYIPQMQHMNNQNPGIINNEYPYYFSYPFPALYGFQQCFYMEQPRSLQENLENIYQRGIVNNIIGAFFIKEHQDKMKSNEKRKVPISKVDLTDEEANINSNNNNNLQNINNNTEIASSKINNMEYIPNGLNQHLIGENNNINDVTKIKGDNNEIKEENINNNDKENNNDKKGKEDNIKNNNNHHANELRKPDMIF